MVMPNRDKLAGRIPVVHPLLVMDLQRGIDLLRNVAAACQGETPDKYNASYEKIGHKLSALSHEANDGKLFEPLTWPEFRSQAAAYLRLVLAELEPPAPPPAPGTWPQDAGYTSFWQAAK